MTTIPAADAQASEPDRSRFFEPFDERPLIRYYRLLFDWHGYIRFLGLPHLKDNPDVPIWELFVAPLFSAMHIRHDAPPKEWGELLGVTEVLRQRSRVVVLGDPGSGKSTLVNWLAWLFSQTGRSSLIEEFGRLVPLPFILRELPIDKEITWDRLVEAFLNRPVAEPLRENRELFEEVLHRGQGLFLLDGLDEIGDLAVREKLREAVWDGFARHDQCKWVMTSRIVGYEQVSFDRNTVSTSSSLPRVESSMTQDGRSFMMPGSIGGARQLFMIQHRSDSILSRANLYYIAPFNNSQIAQFAHAWYSLREPARELAESQARDLVARLAQNPSLQSLARIPNLLTMIALIHRVFRELPHGRVLLYDKITEAYLESIDKQRFVARLGDDIPLATKRRWLAYIGFQMQLKRSETALNASSEPGADEKKTASNEILIDRATVTNWLLTAMRTSRPQTTREFAEAYLGYLARRSGLLLPRGEGLFAFMHLSFQEYFAALYLREQILAPRWLDGGRSAPGTSTNSLREYVNQSAWRETLVLLFEALADYPPWPDELAVVLFGQKIERLRDPAAGEATAAFLLSEISTDPHSGISEEQRRLAWDRCWNWELRYQSKSGLWPDNTEVSGLLMEARVAFGDGTLKSLGEALPSSGRILSLGGCRVPADLQFLVRLSSLEKLSLRGCKEVADLSVLAELRGLKWLDLTGCTSIRTLSPLANLTELEVLCLSGCGGIDDLSAITGLPALHTLLLDQCPQFHDLYPLAALTSLRYLSLDGISEIRDLTPLAQLHELSRLSLENCLSVKDLTPLSELACLQVLTLSGCTEIRDLRPLSRLERLTLLSLDRCVEVCDVSPLAGLPALESLSLNGCVKLSDVRPLARIPHLRLVYLRDCPEIKDFSPLEYRKGVRMTR